MDWQDPWHPTRDYTAEEQRANRRRLWRTAARWFYAFMIGSHLAFGIGRTTRAGEAAEEGAWVEAIYWLLATWEAWIFLALFVWLWLGARKPDDDNDRGVR